MDLVKSARERAELERAAGRAGMQKGRIMAIRLRELFEQVRDLDVLLAAGSAGLNRPVRWVHMVESTEIATFLEGEEVAFTTGIGLSSEDELLDLVKSVYEANASAIVVNLGPFIHQIPPEVPAFCNEHDFPLFRAPWDVHMASIMHRFSLAITKSEKSSMELGGALARAIATPNQQELYLGYLEENGFSAAWNYCACVLELSSAGSLAPHDRRDVLKTWVESIATSGGWLLGMLELEKRLVLVFANYDEAHVEDMVERVMQACQPRLRENERLLVGVGKVTRSARCIGKSHGQARRLLGLLHGRMGADANALFYARMGTYKLLLAIDDREILEDYVQKSIGALLEYDRTNTSALTPVLQSYLAHSGSLQQTADELFVHRNTVSYRLNRIAQILDCDLSDFRTREQLSLGIKAHELLG